MASHNSSFRQRPVAAPTPAGKMTWNVSWFNVLLPALVLSVAFFLVRLVAARRSFLKLQKMGVPVAPDYSFWFGHLLLVKRLMADLPPNANPIYAFWELSQRHFAKQGICYLDLWPLGERTIVVTSPDLAHQATQTNPVLATQRPPSLIHFFGPLTGGPSLFDMPERDWKPWRAVINKSFGPAYFLTLVPGLVEEALVFRDVLRKHARDRDVMRLSDETRRLAMDFVGHTALGTSLGIQKGYNPLAAAMLDQIETLAQDAAVNPLEFLNIPLRLRRLRNDRRMHTYVGTALDQRYQEYLTTSSGGSGASPGGKAVIDLLLQAYMAGHPPLPSSSTTKSPFSFSSKASPPTSTTGAASKTAPHRNEVLDPAFREFATNQIRLFVVAGSDSVSMTICYMLYAMATYPAMLARVRAEHDAVFGRNLAQAPGIIAAEPQRLLKSLPYTDAVIKETLRVFPFATGVRLGAPGPDGLLYGAAYDDDDDDDVECASDKTNNVQQRLSDDKSDYKSTGTGAATAHTVPQRRHHVGSSTSPSTSPDTGGTATTSARCYPTEDSNIWILHPAVHRAPAAWGPRAEEFAPERWLAPPGDALRPADARRAWRPFELGPRACPGMALALLKLRVVLVLVAREFALAPAYAELDAAAAAAASPGGKASARTVRGERAYMIDAGTAQPVDGMPCRVALNPEYAATDGSGGTAVTA